MELLDAINRMYYDLTLNELRLMNDNTLYPNITYNSLLYLDLISYKEKCTVSYLAEALRISKPAVTAKVNELIKLGLVVKKQSLEDKRVFYLSASPVVAEDYKQYDKRMGKAVREVQQHFSKNEIELFCNVLNHIRKAYLVDPV